MPINATLADGIDVAALTRQTGADKSTDRYDGAPFWTWFIENPRNCRAVISIALAGRSADR